jgi:uncharacterized protein YigE (DUF2233 family)
MIRFLCISFSLILFAGAVPVQEATSEFISFTTDASKINFYWKDENGQVLGSIYRMKAMVERQGGKLRFGMNGGMYYQDQSPQGLYIEQGVKKQRINKLSGEGNFYLKPNGVFYITKQNKPVVCKTEDFVESDEVKFATQSGPMLLIDGEIHSAFIKGSANLNIRNGVGILPDNTVVFAMSKQPVNFYDFATFFKDLHCKNALYLDGFVSRTYLPEKKWEQIDGNFGVMIGVTQ